MEQTEKQDKLKKELKGMGIGVLGLFLLIALLSFNANDLSFNSFSSEGGVRNFAGRLGAQLADLLLSGFGVASYLIPFALMYCSYRLLRFKELRWRYYKGVAFFGLLVSLAALFAFWDKTHTLFLGQEVSTGGLFGIGTAGVLKRNLGTAGALLLLLPMLAASIMVLSRFSFVLFADWWLSALGEKWTRFRTRRVLNRELMEKEPRVAEPGAPLIKPLPVSIPLSVSVTKKEKKRDNEKAAPLQEAFEFVKDDGNYRTPSLTLLDAPLATTRKVDKEGLTMNARLLEKKLKDFGVEGEVVEICPGPVVTMYEFAPGPGIKVSRIAGLSDDLSMALQALSIRIVAPIPGKGVVGVELPNRERETVSLKEILGAEEFQRGKMKLPLALGKDISGAPLVTDLARMPHILVAGATGSGKSVSINTMILSLLYTCTPRDLRIIMVDPKMLELSIYEGIPHLLLPVVTNPKKAALALKRAVDEMGRRYRLMADKGVRSVESYNRLLEREEKELAENRVKEPPVPEDQEDLMVDDEAAIQAFLDRDEAL